jgi:hypothetical protein
MHAFILTGWLAIGALPLGGVASGALVWALPLIATVMILLLALLAGDTALARPTRSWKGLGRRGLDRSGRPANLSSAGCACTTHA